MFLEVKPMATNLHLDDELAAKAVNLGGHRTKREAVMQALTEYVRHLEQQRILTLFGTVRCRKDYEYKKQRARR